MKMMKRIISFILVIALLLTMPACATINGEPASFLEVIFFLVKGVHYITVMLTIGLVFVGIALVCEALGIDPDWPWVDSFGTWFTNIRKRMEADLGGTEYIPLETETVEMDHFYADDEGTAGEEKKEKNFLQKLWDKLWNRNQEEEVDCDCETLHYYPEKFAITCKCGRINVTNTEPQFFEARIREEDTAGMDETERMIFISREYRKYYGINHGATPEIMTMLEGLYFPELNDQQYAQLRSMMDFMNEASGKIGDMADDLEDVRVAFKWELGKNKYLKGLANTEMLEGIAEYMGNIGTVTSAISFCMEMQKLDREARDGEDPEEILVSTVEIFKDTLEYIPFYGQFYVQILDGVKIGINSIMSNMDGRYVEDTLIKAAMHIEATPDYIEATGMRVENVQAYENTCDALVHAFNKALTLKKIDDEYVVIAGDKTTWQHGPSLGQLAALNLTPLQIAGLAPYIQYRFEYEFNELYGLALEDLMNLQLQAKNQG